MCGIAGLLLSPKDLQHVGVDEMIKTLGLEIEHRGKDATGVARLTVSDRLRVAKNPVPATEFFLKHPRLGDGCRLALIHTRAWTTGTPADNANNHPITSGPITGIHNGMVTNDDALYLRYKWKRAAEVDSEVIFTAIHNLGWKEALELLQGTIACAWHDMRKPGHLFLARHTSNPIHIGITDSGTILFASTNGAVAKAAAVLGSTSIKIDPIREGVMCDFWIDEDGKLASDVQEFKPPKPVYNTPGRWEYEGGAWFPQGAQRTLPQGTTTVTKGASSGPDWFIGAAGYVLKKNDDVVFEPVDTAYPPMWGTISQFGARKDHVWVEFEFDFGVSEEILIPQRQLWPAAEWRKANQPSLIALPPVTVDNTVEVFDGIKDDEDLQDFYCPRSTEDLVTAIEEIFGEEALDLIPGYLEWQRGDLPSLEFPEEVIDVEEVSTDG